MLRPLRFLGLLMINTVVAVIGTAILETAVWRVFPAHSAVGVLTKEWIISITFATSIGFGMWRTWRSSAAKWTWIVPALWFIFGLYSDSVFSASDRRGFFTFTVPLIRAISYSLGAYISSLL